MYQQSVKKAALSLRKEGYSYAYISQITGLPKSTLSEWLSNVTYIPNEYTVSTLGKARAAASERKAVLKKESIERIREKAEEEIGVLKDHDLTIVWTGSVYGRRGKTRDITRISNSDPRVIEAVIAWFRMLGVKDDQFAPRIHLYPDSDIEECLQFWSKTISIPIPQFHPCHIDHRKDKRPKKQGKLPYGTLHVTVRSNGRKEFGVELFRRIQILNEVVLERIAGVV